MSLEFDLTQLQPRDGVGWLARRRPLFALVDAQGVHVTFGSGKSRSWAWQSAQSWLVLADYREAMSEGTVQPDSAPFRLSRATLSGIDLTEPAGLALLQEAKGAGRTLLRRRDVLPRTRIVCRVYCDSKSRFTRIGRWEPA